MKGLILKDLYTLVKQLKFFLLIVELFAFLPGVSFSGFAIIYAAMLPITAVAYDERSKWNHLAAMMPYSIRNIVASKYALGYLLTACAAVLSLAAQFVVAALKNVPYGGIDVLTIAMFFCVALILQAINLPFMFRFGVEKGRLAFIILIVISTSAMTLGQNILKLFSGITDNMVMVLTALVAVTIILNVASVLLSQKLYAGNLDVKN